MQVKRKERETKKTNSEAAKTLAKGASDKVRTREKKSQSL